ncbi:hypothetical protein U0C82_08195 [Fulvimarina sp. 2208YS6-2-32]|uniref:Uncharacterized protein n=1 Tax=Fulvimarina uroteuthidis TaxID=3098149 RepID=A0ABU5I162_9HYPH|nr:hypothetical protein [Fulvimarina sp. 2208YS6-2-32]MDY8109124.1 hypothetical protein [Fulvimarina sp. 2208YS6-2-32]
MLLRGYPYVCVRIGCRWCDRRGQYPLAVLAQRYGANIPMEQLLRGLSADCGWRRKRKRGDIDERGAYWIDLHRDPPAPPDLPVAPLTVIPGGKR